MNFKDFLAQDIQNTFFNTDEFSDLVDIDGQECTVMIDSERLIKRAEKEYEGITAGLILYFTPVSTFSSMPKVRNTQTFNKMLHFIDSVAENDGVYEILINQNRGG